MIITARCDTAHEKVDILNYIPLVPLENWLLFDGRLIIARRAAANAKSSLRKVLTDAGMSETILEAVSQDSIAAEFEKDPSKQGRSLAVRFGKAATSLADANVAAVEGLERSQALNYLKNTESVCKSLIKELTENQIGDFHFVDRCEPMEACRGYVALLREIRFIPSFLGRAVADGLDIEAYEALVQDDLRAYGKLRLIGIDDFAMPIGTIESPFIELIMQRLTLLFGRIGVSDIETARLRSVQQVLDTMGKE